MYTLGREFAWETESIVYKVVGHPELVAMKTDAWYKKAWYKHIGLCVDQQKDVFILTKLYHITEDKYFASRIIQQICAACYAGQNENEPGCAGLRRYAEVLTLRNMAKLKSQQAQQLYTFMEEHRKRLFNGDYMLDLHALNVMQTRTGKLVITDPFYKRF